MKKKITIFSPVFPPEKGASPSRMYRLAKLLADNGHDVQVVCFMPNYPTGKIFSGYRGSLVRSQQFKGINVKRIWAYPSNSANAFDRMFSMATQSLSIGLYCFVAFAFRSRGLVIINTPPLLSAYIAALSAKVCRQQILLNVSDLWPLTALELGAVKKGIFYSLLQKVEKRLYRLADQFIGQSREILAHLERLTTVDKKSFLYYNLQENAHAIHQHKTFLPPGRRRLVYAGLLGVAQGVYDICSNIDFAAMQLELHIYGEGNEKEKILGLIRNDPGCNIHYHGSVPASKMPSILVQFDATLIPLKTIIHGALPSKIFMAMAHGLPVVFSADGEGVDIIKKYETGWVNKAGDYATLRNNLQEFAHIADASLAQLAANGTKAAYNVFNKNKQDAAFLQFLEESIK